MEVLGYELNAKNSNYVGEGCDLFGTKPYLFTTNLYSCVGIYAMCGNIKYLGHIDVSRREEEFAKGRTEKVFFMFDELADMKEKINDTIFVGLVYGISLDEYHRDKYHIILDNLEEVSDKLRDMGLEVEIQDPLTSENIVIDGEKRMLITDEEDLDFNISKAK
jgi:hypothetical protein